MSETSPEHILALDIGTEYVKAMIAVPAKNGDLDIIGISRTHQEAGSMVSGAISDIKNVTDVCEQAISEAEQQAGFIAKSTIVGLAGELVKSNSTTIKYVRLDPNKTINDSELSNLISKIQQKAKTRVSETIADESVDQHTELRLISSAISSIFIDGHKVANPIGFKGTQLEITLYTAFAPLVHISAIEKVCAELRLDLIAIAVEPFAVARACLSEQDSEDLSVILIDIGGGTTDIAVINSGGIINTNMFDVAGRSFTRVVANTLSVDEETAEKLKTHLDDPRLKSTVYDKITGALEQNLKIWLSGIDIALRDFDNLDMLPSQIYLSGGGASLELIPELLATSNWYSDLPFSHRPLVDLLDVTAFPGLNNQTDLELDYTYATVLGLLRVAIDTDALSSDSATGKVKTRIKKLLKN